MLKAIIFDLDGTLLDRDTSLKAFVENQHQRMAELQHIDKSVYVNRFVALDQRGYVWKDQVYQQLIHEFDLALQWEDLLEDYMHQFSLHCVGFPNLHELLIYLKESGFKLGLISNGYGTFQMKNMEALRISTYFDTILVSEIEGLRKPDPEIFHRALHRLGAQPGEAAYVGDHPENDVQASRRVGMKGIWKEDDHFAGNFEREYTIRDLMELKKYLEQLHTGST
ncbi:MULTISPECIES: HAD-IA family hydrolase [Paenibacillus]|uniref:HAD-IA family hydrolase n=1 Tax=Paenibacillus violae TaxID=3077234 RepID=A0ABU3R8W7_9BACL|nr:MULTISPECIES: HAD-IA family hydrolase [Paenibacillus]MDU0200711.1 HAD-IA family hydrolase [Paenibacillus sp. PFR10]MEC0267130.1 HAD-IA family hydrolase [Paenibacillus anseongense]